VISEHWEILSLAGTELPAPAPVVGEKDNLADFTRELIRLQWRSDDPIDLYVIIPKHVERPPVILYLYSYPSDIDRFRDNGFCVRATKGGVAAVGFASAMTGHRYHQRPMKQWFVSELPEALGTSVHDVQMLLNYLSRRGDLDTDHTGMFGTGSGATIGILASAVDKRIRVLDLLDPWGDWPEWLAKSSLVPNEERPAYLKSQFYQRVAPFEPANWLPRVQAQRIRLQHVMDDSVTPFMAKERLERCAPRNAEIVHFENTEQLFSSVSGGRIFEWAKQQLLRGETRVHSYATNKAQSADE
jgi:hypothetical protein